MAGIIMSESIFVVVEAPADGYTAGALGESLFTRAEIAERMPSRNLAEMS